MMTAFDTLQLVAVLGSLAFVAYQSWLMRKALQEQRNEARVQSYLQVWMNHIQTCHIPVATADERTAEALNSMSPYRGVDLPEARRCHFADAALDFYECIQLLAETGILDEEAARVWKDSVPYEMRNPNLRAHWRRYHHSGENEPLPNIGALGIYHRNFLRYVEECILKADTVDQKHSTDGASREANAER
jgi:hypothetical protein